MNSLNKWYQRLGAFLISFGVFTAALFLVRFTIMKSIGFVIFLDDFLTIGLANIFLFPCEYGFYIQVLIAISTSR